MFRTGQRDRAAVAALAGERGATWAVTFPRWFEVAKFGEPPEGWVQVEVWTSTVHSHYLSDDSFAFWAVGPEQAEGLRSALSSYALPGVDGAEQAVTRGGFERGFARAEHGDEAVLVAEHRPWHAGDCLEIGISEARPGLG